MVIEIGRTELLGATGRRRSALGICSARSSKRRTRNDQCSPARRPRVRENPSVKHWAAKAAQKLNEAAIDALNLQQDKNRMKNIKIFQKNLQDSIDDWDKYCGDRPGGPGATTRALPQAVWQDYPAAGFGYDGLGVDGVVVPYVDAATYGSLSSPRVDWGAVGTSAGVGLLFVIGILAGLATAGATA